MPKKSTKTTKTTKTRTVKKTAPVMNTVPQAYECPCGAECHCGCHHGKFKKFIVLLIVFLIGFAAAKFTCCPHRHHMRKGPEMHPVFENGCLDMASIKCPKMVETLQVSAANADACITLEEFQEVKEAMHREMREHHHMPKPADAE